MDLVSSILLSEGDSGANCIFKVSKANNWKIPFSLFLEEEGQRPCDVVPSGRFMFLIKKHFLK